MAVFSIVSAQERRGFWNTLRSKALVAVVLIGAVITRLGLPGLTPDARDFRLCGVACLIVNDTVKVAMIK